MKSLTKKLLSIFMVLCLTLLSFGLVVNVKAAAGDITFTFTNDVAITGTHSTRGEQTGTLTSNGVSLPYAIKGIRTGANDTNRYSYIMFDANEGYVYSTAAVSGYYPSKITAEFTSGTSKTGKILASFGTGVISTRQTASTTVTKGGSYTLTNTDSTKLFWNFSTAIKNVQVTTITVVYSPAGVSKEPLAAPANGVLEDNIVMFDSVTNATSYKVGLFLDSTTLVPYKEFETQDNIYEIAIDEQSDYYVRVKALTTSETYGDSEYSDVIGVYSNKNVFKEISIEQLLTMEPDNKEIKTYYKISGKVINITNTQYGNFDLTDGNNSILVWGLTKTKVDKNDQSFNQLGLKENDFITIYGVLGAHDGKNQIVDAYFGEKVVDYKEIFKSQSTMATLNVSYITKGNTQNLLQQSFITKAKDDKTLPAGWTGKVGGAYSSLWQSFRDDNCYIQSPEFAPESSITVSFRCYLNNSKPGTSIVTISGLNAQNQVVDSFVSQNFNTLSEGEKNAINVTGSLTGENITKVKVLFNKDNGGNIAFSEITIGYPLSYELSKDQNNLEKNMVGLRFGAMIDNELVDNLYNLATLDISFGVAYVKKSELSGKTFEQALADKTAHFEECSPVIVDENGKESAQGTKQQFAIVLNHIPTIDFAEEVTAACYVCIDGTYYYMQTKTFSVNSIAQYYVDNLKDDVAVKDHVEMLKWLASLNA